MRLRCDSVPLAAVYPLVSARAVARAFTYGVPEGTEVGAVVEARFGNRRLRGVVAEVGVDPPDGIAVADVERVAETLPPALVELALWLAGYYGSTPARTLALVAPVTRRRRGDRREPTVGAALAAEPAPPHPTAEQRAAVERIVAGGGPYLLYGPTGSGKTEVYLRACAAML